MKYSSNSRAALVTLELYRQRERPHILIDVSTIIYKFLLEVYRRSAHSAALTVVRKHRLEGKNPISEADLEWIFARNYEGTE